MTIQQAFELGLQHHQSGRLADAEGICRQILAVEPSHADALHMLGVIAGQVGHHAIAVDLIRRAIALKPAFPDAHYNLGITLHRMGHLGDAIAAYVQAVTHEPNYPEAHNNLGVVLRDMGRLNEAIASCRQAIALMPDYAEAHINLGNALRDTGQLDEAIAACHQAIALTPSNPKAHNNLGNALTEKGRTGEAVTVFRQAIALNPNFPEAYNNLGNALVEKGQLIDAIAVYRQAIALKPDSPEFHTNLGMALKTNGQLDDAIATYRQAITLKPDNPEAHSSLIFTLDLIGSADLAQHQEERRCWYEQHARKFAAQITPHQNGRDPERRLRVGYVSADFRKHSACSVFAPVLCEHDRTAFELFCYSGVKCEDDVTARLRNAAHTWRSTLGVSDDALAEQIRQDRIDILVDLSGHSAGNRLLVFARKPAPVQVVAWGYCNGTGIKTIDYLLGDSIVVPEHVRGLYAEEVFDLPCVLGYEPPDYLPEVSPLPSLHGNPLTYGCVNRIEKITDLSITLWGRILHESPTSRLLVKEKVLDDPGSRRQFLKRLHEVGHIEESRVLLAGSSPHDEHLKIFHQIDIGLDPFPHGGGVSTAEALWMGIPVVTLLGDTVPGRISASMLNMLEMQDWVAQTEDDYVRIALQAGRELPRLAQLRRELRERLRRSPWGDGRYTRSVEQAYRQMWRAWCANPRALLPVTARIAAP